MRYRNFFIIIIIEFIGSQQWQNRASIIEN